jgi:hypothetical protein
LAIFVKACPGCPRASRDSDECEHPETYGNYACRYRAKKPCVRRTLRDRRPVAWAERTKRPYTRRRIVTNAIPAIKSESRIIAHSDKVGIGVTVPGAGASVDWMPMPPGSVMVPFCAPL